MLYKSIIVELHYLPCVEYFVYLSSFQKVIINIGDLYTKQTYRNRARIHGANNVENLIVPIKKWQNQKTLTKDVEIDYTQKWLNRHIRAIRSAYGKAPFFEYYGDEILEIYHKKHIKLFELNIDLLTKCLEILDINIEIQFMEIKKHLDENSYYNALNEVNPKNAASRKSIFVPEKYFQIFGKDFVENLSIIDLIFCEGPNARHIIEKSRSIE